MLYPQPFCLVIQSLAYVLWSTCLSNLAPKPIHSLFHYFFNTLLSLPEIISTLSALILSTAKSNESKHFIGFVCCALIYPQYQRGSFPNSPIQPVTKQMIWKLRKVPVDYSVYGV